ncbi:LysE family translocator [Falsiroseomonas selenitidurans]|uniref:LysE family translocator n=1 Tax=Falsiroseomonas selenitidurans TaxID=2716335 RepID=A0ABX1E8P7_9PROT|nr:LysE family translocator [Falsiroseomonas selenitidurans]NKC32183.1 LysE family translocator [Falsiroseomonas selenitidurans]
MPLDPQLFAAFLLAAWVLILTPGPDMLFVIGQALAGGARRGWAAMFGIVTGAMVHVALVTSGVAALIAASPALFEALRLAGAGYLIWLGLGALRAAWRGGGALRPAAPARAAFRQGFLTNLTNPKVILFFLAFLPQFVDPARGPAWLQMVLMGPLVPLMSLPAYGLLIAGAGHAAARLGRQARWLEGLAGAIFLGLGLRLLFGLRPA